MIATMDERVYWADLAPRPEAVYIDVETVPVEAQQGDLVPPQWCFDETELPRPALGKLPANWKDPVKLAEKSMELVHKLEQDNIEYAAEWERRAWKAWEQASVDPTRARILLGCVLIGDNPDPVVMTEMELFAFIDQESPKRLVAFNAGFDRQMLYCRAAASGERRVAVKIRSATWEDPGQRVRDLGSRWYPQKGPRMKDVSRMLGIPQDTSFDGSQVLKAYLSGEVAKVREHCLDDVRVLRAIDRWLP